MRKYDSYKKSTFDWMGEIPSHWILTKNRYGFQKYSNGKNESDDTPVLSLTTRGVKVKTNLSFGKSTESYVGHQLVEKGDIVFTPRDFDQTPILSDVSNFFGCISNLYIVDKTKEIVLNHYVNYYWYGLKYSVDYFKNFSHGMRYSFNRFQFDEIPLLLPPLSEQQQIVSFLDTKTSLIDSLIEKTYRKIELLKENRTSLINEVVTKGLNPNVEMKDSGVEWIGEIPSHWDTSFFRYYIKLRHGYQFREYDFTDEGIKIVKITQLHKDGYLDISNCSTIDSTRLNEFSDITIKEKDILMCLTGGTIGKIIRVGKVSEPLLQNYRVGHFTTKDTNILSDNFLFYLMSSEVIIGQIFYDVRETGQPNIGLEDMNRMRICLPPLSEQNEIVSYLDEHTQLIDKTISLEERRIDTLKEYRQSLISEVVTGKRKVVTNE
jgi:type I restriction enzyme S subunit